MPHHQHEGPKVSASTDRAVRTKRTAGRSAATDATARPVREPKPGTEPADPTEKPARRRHRRQEPAAPPTTAARTATPEPATWRTAEPTGTPADTERPADGIRARRARCQSTGQAIRSGTTVETDERTDRHEQTGRGRGTEQYQQSRQQGSQQRSEQHGQQPTERHGEGTTERGLAQHHVGSTGERGQNRGRQTGGRH